MSQQERAAGSVPRAAEQVNFEQQLWFGVNGGVEPLAANYDLFLVDCDPRRCSQKPKISDGLRESKALSNVAGPQRECESSSNRAMRPIDIRRS